MTAPNVTLTQVEAVNRVLRTGLGSMPVNSLADPLPTEAVHAREKLDDVLRDLQARGWNFNYDTEVDLTPDGDGFINLPADGFHAVYRGDNRATRSVVQRGRRMYDETAKTYVFSNVLTVQVTTRLAWEQLPYPVQRYCITRAARELAAEMGMPPERYRAAAQAESMAAHDLQDFESESAGFSLLGGTTAARILARRNPPFEV